MHNIKTIFQFDAKLRNAVDHSISQACYDWIHSIVALPSAEQCQAWGLRDVATPPQPPYALTWYNSFNVWREVVPGSKKSVALENIWYEFGRFAANTHEIYSPHHVTRECLIAYAECMVDRGLKPASQSFRLKCIESIFGKLAATRVLKSNPARGLRRSCMVD
jgi:hypothetical protein